MDYLKAFLVGGAICMLGQLLIDKTRLTPARILVCYVVLGVILGGAGVYDKLVDFAGAGATVPLTGFGNTLAKGVREAVKEQGILGALTGGLKASAAGIAAASRTKRTRPNRRTPRTRRKIRTRRTASNQNGRTPVHGVLPFFMSVRPQGCTAL